MNEHWILNEEILLQKEREEHNTDYTLKLPYHLKKIVVPSSLVQQADL